MESRYEMKSSVRERVVGCTPPAAAVADVDEEGSRSEV